MTNETIDVLDAELALKKEALTELKPGLAEADDIRRQWDAYVKQLRIEQKATMKEALAGFNVAKNLAKEKRDAFKALEAEAKALRKQIKEAKGGPSAAEKSAKQKEREAWKAANTANGVTRPRPGTTGHRVWEIADTISAETKAPATFAEVKTASAEEDIPTGTVSGNYAHWRAFYGLPPHMQKDDEPEQTVEAAELEEQG